MYDYVKIKTDLLPVSDYYKSFLGEYNRWQTKDYLCELGGIELREDSTVWYIEPKPIIRFYGNNPKDKYRLEFSVEIENGKWSNSNLIAIEPY